jgi:hypothetical protein
MAAIVSRNSLVDFAPMKNESVLFQPQTNQFCLLNATATFVWSQLDRPCTVTDLAQAVCDHFDDVSLPEAIRDVEQTLNELQSLSYLTLSHA